MDKKPLEITATKFKAFIIGAFALTAVGIALRIINLFFFFDSDIGYYTAGAALPVVMNIFFLLATLCFVAGAIFFSRAINEKAVNKRNIATVIVGSLCALASAGLAINLLPAMFFDNPTLLLTLTLFSLLSCSYFILSAMNKFAKARAFLALATVITLVFVLAVSYFNVYIQMNSPNKLLLHIACISSMFFFINEARAAIGDMRHKFYSFSLFTALFFTGAYSIPSYIAFLAEKNLYYSFYYFDLLFIPLFIYLAARALTILLSREKRETTEEITDDTSNERN